MPPGQESYLSWQSLPLPLALGILISLDNFPISSYFPCALALRVTCQRTGSTQLILQRKQYQNTNIYGQSFGKTRLHDAEYMLCSVILAQGNSGFAEKFLLLFT